MSKRNHPRNHYIPTETKWNRTPMEQLDDLARKSKQEKERNEHPKRIKACKLLIAEYQNTPESNILERKTTQAAIKKLMLAGKVTFRDLEMTREDYVAIRDAKL